MKAHALHNPLMATVIISVKAMEQADRLPEKSIAA
jgi:hypothetical protein